MIADYADLMVASHEYAGRNDLAHLFGRFLSFAETKLNRMLRVSDMEDSDTITVTDGEGALPADFLEMREVRIGTSYPAIQARPLAYLKDAYVSAGIPQGYAIVGSDIILRPSWTGSLPIQYYAKIPALTIASPTNWLLTKAPNAYLYGVVEQIAIWERDVEKARAAGGLMLNEVMAVQSADNDKRFANAKVSFGGCTP